MSIIVPTATIQIKWNRKKDESFMGRLSPDLAAMAAEDDTLSWDVDKKSKKLILESNGGKDRLKVWGSNERSKSGYIGMTGIFEALEIKNPEKLVGKTFDAEVTGKKIEIQF